MVSLIQEIVLPIERETKLKSDKFSDIIVGDNISYFFNYLK